MPAGSDETACTPKVFEPLASTARFPTLIEQTAPALKFGAQTQPMLEPVAVKVPLAGTVAVSTRPAASWVPLFTYESV